MGRTSANERGATSLPPGKAARTLATSHLGFFRIFKSHLNLPRIALTELFFVIISNVRTTQFTRFVIQTWLLAYTRLVSSLHAPCSQALRMPRLPPHREGGQHAAGVSDRFQIPFPSRFSPPTTQWFSAGGASPAAESPSIAPLPSENGGAAELGSPSEMTRYTCISLRHQGSATLDKYSYSFPSMRRCWPPRSPAAAHRGGLPRRPPTLPGACSQGLGCRLPRHPRGGHPQWLQGHWQGRYPWQWRGWPRDGPEAPWEGGPGRGCGHQAHDLPQRC